MIFRRRFPKFKTSHRACRSICANSLRQIVLSSVVLTVFASAFAVPTANANTVLGPTQDAKQKSKVKQKSETKKSDSKSKKGDKEDKDAPPEGHPEQPFVADFDDQDLAGSEKRAWEYRPYQVAVWFCLDGSPVLNSVYKELALEVTRRSEVLDGSGWDLTTGLAPSRWRYRFLKDLDHPEKFKGIGELKSLEGYDKLMVVCLSSGSGENQIRVREFDVQTQQWGPVVVRKLAQHANLGQSVMDSIAMAFMPIAKIDRIDEIPYEDAEGKKRIKDQVVMQIRGVLSCLRSARQPMSDDEPVSENPSFGDTTPADEADPPIDPPESEIDPLFEPDRFPWSVEPNVGSPVYVKDDDRFLPVIRKTDRKGNLVKLEPIEFTYLTVDGQEKASLQASIESYHRAPLAQRKSKRAQKLALVIRPPQRSTTLYLKTMGRDPQPLEGFEIWSRRPGAPREEKSKFLGKTNWRGAFEVQPNDEGLQIIYVKRGSRALRRLPIIPGLYESVSTTLPNDETRLFAEGVIQGLQNEILSLVIRREVFESDIEAAIKEKDTETAKKKLELLEKLESPTDFKARMSEDLSSLKFKTSDTREVAYITDRFDTLFKLLNEQQIKSRESEFRKEILRITDPNATPAQGQ